MSVTATANMIKVPVNGRIVVLDRDLLAAAMVLRMDNPHNLIAVPRLLRTEFGVAVGEATRLSVAAEVCLKAGIEP